MPIWKSFRVLFANGDQAWALIGNVTVDNARLTEHFVTASLERNGRWFTLARYHDSNYGEFGPEALASFLGLPLDDLFPISYDIRAQVKCGDAAALAGQIPREPRERLTRAQIIALAVS